jgi:hypothetical protein
VEIGFSTLYGSFSPIWILKVSSTLFEPNSQKKNKSKITFRGFFSFLFSLKKKLPFWNADAMPPPLSPQPNQ